MPYSSNDFENLSLSGEIERDIELFKSIFKTDATLRVKRLKVRNRTALDCALIYIDGMVDSEQLNDAVIKPLLVSAPQKDCDLIADYIATQVLFARDVKSEASVSKLLSGILYGEALLLIDKSATALSIDVKGFRTRGIKEPDSERVLQGPREGFDETALLNLAMIRRKLQTPDLCTEMVRVGRRSSTMVFMCYLGSLADKSTLDLIKKRIKNIDIDGVLDSNYIAELICDNNSLFKTCGTTERPDTVAGKLLEGRIALIVDGTPVVLTVPYLFSESFQSDEDYYLGFLSASLGRIFRYICFFLAIATPALFIAVSVYHKELLPTSLTVAIAKLRGGVPFSPVGEAVIMIFVFEILRQAGVRMPQSLGHALSIVGGLVVGQAAVDAKIIGTPILIVTAISGIAGLMIPKLTVSVFYLRFIFLLSAAFLGLFGFICSLTIMIIHIFSLSSFGTDYTVSLQKSTFNSLKDTLIRVPWKFMKTRPIFNKNLTRLRKKTK